MFDFTYILKDGEYVRALNSQNPQYCMCERFFPKQYPIYKNFGEIQPFNEIVTVDRGLTKVIKRLDESTALTCEIADDRQILYVFCMLDENGDDIEDPDIAKKEIPGFEFCGFDLADGFLTSSLTNCEGGFDKAFTYRDLNKYGLISGYWIAKEIQEKLGTEYDDDHAYCEMFAIFRRTKK